jgi:predicted neutral ceramidase superfamily lipid hydrolase
MEILRNVLLVLHFVGLASLLGGVIAQVPAMRSGAAKLNSAVFHGALTQLVTGILLVGVIQMADLGDINNMKIGAKLAVVIVITVLVIVYRKKEKVANWVPLTIAGLTLLNICFAVFWG